MDFLTILKEVGLKEDEAKTYLSLLKIGGATATQLSNESKIERTLIYKVLEKLIDKGLVSYNIQNKKRYFYPTDPKRILENLKEKEELLKEILPSLISLKIEERSKVKVEIWKNIEGLKSLIREILASKQEFVSVGGGFNFAKLLSYFGKYWMRQLEKRKIRERVIVPEDLKITLRSKYSQFRYLSKDYPLVGGFGVVENKVGFYIRTEPILVVTIENKEFANTFRNYFELLWKIAKKE